MVQSSLIHVLNYLISEPIFMGQVCAWHQTGKTEQAYEEDCFLWKMFFLLSQGRPWTCHLLDSAYTMIAMTSSSYSAIWVLSFHPSDLIVLLSKLCVTELLKANNSVSLAAYVSHGLFLVWKCVTVKFSSWRRAVIVDTLKETLNTSKLGLG